MMWLRLDCDNPIFYKTSLLNWKGYLNYLSLATNCRIPFIHNKPVLETKQFLRNYDIERVWFFRPLTCPESWDEPFGLHATYKDAPRFRVELEKIEEKLGHVHSFTHHGFASVKSGTLWSREEVEHIEKTFGLKDLTEVPHYTVTRGSGLQPEHECILFHPCHLHIACSELTQILNEASS